MKEIIDSFSSRDISIWVLSFFALILVLALILKSKSLRITLKNEAKNVAKTANSLILFSLLFFILYNLLEILFLYKFKLWDFSLLKDSFYWLLGTGLMFFVNIKETDNPKFFRNFIFEAISLTAFLEAFIDLFTFNIGVEIFIISCYSFLYLISFFAKKDPKHSKVVKLIFIIKAYIIYCYFWYIVYKFLSQPLQYTNFNNFKGFFIEIVHTILFLPFIYLFLLFDQYYVFFQRVNYLLESDEIKKKTKLNTILTCNLSPKKITNFNNHITNFKFF